MEPQKIHLIILLEPKGQFLRELQWWISQTGYPISYCKKYHMGARVVSKIPSSGVRDGIFDTTQAPICMVHPLSYYNV